MTRNRNRRGTILFLVALAAAVIVLVGVIGFIFNGFLFSCTKAQYDADAIALSMAMRINEGDRVGQMNKLEECSRELVYVSNQHFQKCSEQDLDVLEPLCNQLWLEARDGHDLVENERKNQISLICTELQRAATEYNKAAENQPGLLNIRWLSAKKPLIENVFVGTLKNTESNVKQQLALPELAEIDREHGYIDPNSNYFLGNINAQLPDEQAMNFYISRLPAYVAGTCAPARNANADVFGSPLQLVRNGKSTAFNSGGQIPCAVQITCLMEAKVGGNNKGTVRLLSTGVTSGATASSQ